MAELSSLNWTYHILGSYSGIVKFSEIVILLLSIFRWEQNPNLLAEMIGTLLADWGTVESHNVFEKIDVRGLRSIQ